MTTAPIAMDRQIIHDSFRAWCDEQDSLDQELAESLAALEAYQSHLDAWQRELAGERQALEHDREQLEHDHTAAKDHAAELEKVTTELSEARAQNASLSKALLERTEELRQLDGRRAELTTELELARAREKDLAAALQQQEQSLDEQRSQWTEELKHLRELLERQKETPKTDCGAWDGGQLEASGEDRPPGSPVLGSIVEQFGKLRQQRALGRHNRTKTG